MSATWSIAKSSAYFSLPDFCDEATVDEDVFPLVSSLVCLGNGSTIMSSILFVFSNSTFVVLVTLKTLAQTELKDILMKLLTHYLNKIMRETRGNTSLSTVASLQKSNRKRKVDNLAIDHVVDKFSELVKAIRSENNGINVNELYEKVMDLIKNFCIEPFNIC